MTKLWHVQLVRDAVVSWRQSYCLRVGLSPAAGAVHSMKIRSITAGAAVRTYIRNNLPVKLYLLDDGGNRPEDLRADKNFLWRKKRRSFRDMTPNGRGGLKIIYAEKQWTKRR